MSGRLAQVHPMPTTNKARSAVNNYISSCSRCGWGIFVGQPHHWSQDPLGLVHTDPKCKERP